MSLENNFKSALSNEPSIITKLTKLGYEVERDMKYLSKGLSSDVFVVNEKYVIKLTKSEIDIRRWKTMIGKKPKNIAHTLIVEDLNFTGGSGESRRGIIVQKYYKGIFKYSDYSTSDYKTINLWHFRNIFDRMYETESFDDIYYEYANEEYERSVIKDNTKTKNMFKQFYNALLELHKFGFVKHSTRDLDIHENNIRFDDKGVLKIIDF